MRATTILYICLAVLLLQACGISAEEKRNIEQAALERKAAQDSIQALLVRMDVSRNETEAALAVTKGELEAAQVTLARVKDWQFGRTRDERDQQIVNASLKVQALEAKVVELMKHLSAIEAEQERTTATAKYMESGMQDYEGSQ